MGAISLKFSQHLSLHCYHTDYLAFNEKVQVQLVGNRSMWYVNPLTLCAITHCVTHCHCVAGRKRRMRCTWHQGGAGGCGQRPPGSTHVFGLCASQTLRMLMDANRCSQRLTGRSSFSTGPGGATGATWSPRRTGVVYTRKVSTNSISGGVEPLGRMLLFQSQPLKPWHRLCLNVIGPRIQGPAPLI